MIDYLFNNDYALFVGLFAISGITTTLFIRQLYYKLHLPDTAARYTRFITVMMTSATLLIPVIGYLVSHHLSTPKYHFYLFGFSACSFLILCVFIITVLFVLTRNSAWIHDTYLSEHHFQTVFNGVPEAVVICSKTNGIITAANVSAIKLFAAEPIGQSIPGLITGDKAIRPLSLPLSIKELSGLFVLGKETSPRLWVSSMELQYEGMTSVALFILDVSTINTALNALATNELHYREIMEFLPEGVFETDHEGIFTYANKRAFDLLGYTYTDIARKISLLDVIVPQDRPFARSDIAAMYHDRQQRHHEYTALHRSGKQIPILVQSTVIIRNDTVTGICGIVIDLTERKKIEEELQKKDKLEALGIFAGGIAHDFNNLLTAIWSGFSILKIRFALDEELHKIILEMENAIVRGKDLTGQLLTYSKGGAPVKNAASLGELVTETAQFVTRGTNIKCDITADVSIDIVEIDGTQISQVIQNLLLNAKEAMVDGGTVRVHLCNRHNFFSHAHPDIPPGDYVELAITDTGSGIPLELQSRICDPFFTTKPHGSGLGLATSYSIIKNHAGHIYFESSPGVGTSFHILLPVSTRTIKQKKAISQQLHQGKGRILLLDDEPAILSMSCKILNLAGYTVTTATTGEEAIELYKEAFNTTNKFDLAILDLTIPAGIGGKEAITKIHEFDPGAKAIVSSGYSNDPIMSDHQRFGFTAVIKKPYDVHQLAAVVQKVINGERIEQNVGLLKETHTI